MDSFEIIFMRSGRLVMQEGKEKFTLGPNEAILLYPGREHAGLSDYEKDTSFYWIHFRLQEGQYRVAEGEASQASFIAVPQVSRPERSERLIELYRQFLHSQEDGFACGMEADLLVGQMLIELAFHVEAGAGNRAAMRLAEAVKKIVNAEFFKSDLSPGVVAEKLEVNCDYLGRVFRLVVGESIGSFIIHRRLRESRKLLQESDLNVNQVAMAVGFNDPGYFRRVFRRQYDIRPAEFRKMYYRVHVNIK
jgi:AraC-like DNA-binding protein